MSPEPTPPALPARAEEFLDDVAGTNDQDRTRRTYRNNLGRLQAFAKAAKYTQPGPPCPLSRFG